MACFHFFHPLEWSLSFKMRRYLIIIMLIFAGCTKEFNIADFSDDFSSYESELRIEAILNPNDFMNSIVRIDKTLLVTDTSLFNGLDDNGDWVGYTDENNNGQWDEGEPLNDDIGDHDGNGIGDGKPDKGEPHVDDLKEILPFVHDSTMQSVELRDKSNGALIAEFEWKTNAGMIEEILYNEEGEEESINVIKYGGYAPSILYAETEIEYNKEYEFQIKTSDGDFITGVTIPLPSAELNMENTTWDADTLLLSNEDDIVEFYIQEDVPLCIITFREVINADSVLYSYSAYFPPQESDVEGKSICQLVRGFFPIGTSQLTISVLSYEYGQYILSSLPLDDTELSNLRDQDGNVVLGICGSATETVLYIRNNY